MPIRAIRMTFFVIGITIWGIAFDNNAYGQNKLMLSKNLNNEGPFVFEKDSVYLIKYLKGNSKQGYFVEQQTQRIDKIPEISCYYFPDSSSFSFKLKRNTTSEIFEYSHPQKIIAISDIESNYKTFRNFLIINEVIDANLNWIFGEGHLVLIGDFIDRSYFTIQVLWFIYKLEQEAEKYGGKVHYLLGNHEIMNIQGDHRYATKKYINVASVLGIKQLQLYDTTTHLGEWLQTKNVVEKIGDYVFVHGGLSPELVEYKIDINEINQIARKNYQRPYFSKINQHDKEELILGSSSPYWYRGYFENKLSQEVIDKILKFYNCSQIIVGHTIQDKVNRKYEGKIIGIDVEHPQDFRKYLRKKSAQGLLIENDIFYRIDDTGNRIEI